MGLIGRIKEFVKYDDKLLRKMILSNTAVLCITSLIDALSVNFDEMIAARELGPDAMAAVGLSSPSFYIICIFAGVIAYGSQSLCTYYIGKGDKKANDSIFTDLVILSIIGAVVLTAAVSLFLDPLCILFGASKSDPVVYGLLHDYLKGLLWVVPGYIGFLAFSPFVILDGNKKCVWAASAVQLLVSAIGDILSVYVLDLGLYGIGTATGVGYIAAVLVLLTDFRGETLFHFDLRLFDPGYFARIIWTGSPRFSRYVSGFLVRLFINNIIILFGGKMAMAVFSVKNSVSTFLCMVGYGLSESVIYATQLLYGEGARKELYNMIQTVVRIALVITCSMSLLVILLVKPIAVLFIKDNVEILDSSMFALRCLALSIPLNTINGIIIGYLQGSRKIVKAKAVTWVQKFIGYIAATYVLGYFFGEKGLYVSVPVCEVLTFLTYLIMVFFYRKADTPEARSLFIPESFDKDIKCSFLFSIRNSDEVAAVLDRISPLMQTEGYTDRKGLFRLHLCIEEIVGNVLHNCFTLDNRTHYCNIRVMLYHDNTVTIGVRDDCPRYDLKEAYESLTEDNMYLHPELKLIFGIPKEIEYNHLLGYNNTIVKI